MNSTTTLQPPPARTGQRWLRASLLIDAAVTGVNGLAYIVGAAMLSTVLGPPAAFLVGIGAFLTSCAIAFLLVGRARRIPLAGAWFAIVVNSAWSVGSVIHAITAEWLTPIGVFWTVLQALVVLGFAVAQVIGVRRARR